MEPFAFIIFLLAIGFLLQKVPAPEDFAKSLNFFIIYISLPATVLIQIPNIHFDHNALMLILTPWLLLPVVIGLVIWMTRGYDSYIRAALLLVIPLGNTSFVAIPILHTLLGEESIPYVLMYDQFGTFLMLSIYGTIVISRYESGIFHKRLIVKKLLLFPPFGFLILGLFLESTPLILKPYLELLASTLVPLALVSVGYSLRFGGEIDYGMLGKALVLKLIVMPLMVLAVLLPLHSDPLALKTAVLESGMPSMITAGALAIASGFAPALSAALVGYGIIICLVTLPMILYGLNIVL